MSIIGITVNILTSDLEEEVEEEEKKRKYGEVAEQGDCDETAVNNSCKQVPQAIRVLGPCSIAHSQFPGGVLAPLQLQVIISLAL